MVVATTTTRTAAQTRRRPRAATDWYVESERAVDALLDVETFPGPIWDPACGGGNIPKRCKARGLTAYGSDIVDRGFGYRRNANFLMVPPPSFLGPEWSIVTNPPFDLAVDFVARALELQPARIAILARLAFLEGQRRGKWLRAFPPARVWIFSRRESMPPGDMLAAGTIKRGGGAVAYCWLVWERKLRSYGGPTTLDWLP